MTLIAVWQFIMSPIGKVLLAVLLLVSFAAYFDHRGASRVRGQWAAANAEAQRKADARDTEISRQAEQMDQRDLASELENEKRNLEAKNEYIAELEKRVNSACVIDDGDLKRLRDIR